MFEADRDDGRRPDERLEAEEPNPQPGSQPALTAETPSEERPDEAEKAGPPAPLTESKEAVSTTSTVTMTITVPSMDEAVSNPARTLALDQPGINWEDMVRKGDTDEESDADSMTTHIPDRPDLGSVHEGGVNPLTRSSATSRSSGESSTAQSTETHALKDSVLGRISLPSKSGDSADSYNPAPVIAEEEESDYASPREVQPQNLSTETSIVGLSRHETSGNVYVLIKSGSDYLLSRLRPGGKVPDLSFVVASETNEDVRMTVVGDHIVTSSTGQILAYRLDGVREQEIGITRRVADVAERGAVLYTLLNNGEVASYTVPKLERLAVVHPDSRQNITRALRIAILQGSVVKGISAILAERSSGGYVINFYAANEEALIRGGCLCSILLQSDAAPNSCSFCFASANELIISHHALLLTTYVWSTSRRILLDKITALCSSDNDHVLIARNNQIEVFDLKEARGTLENIVNPMLERVDTMSEYNVDKNDVPSVRLETRLLWRLGSSGGIHRIAVNKQSGELIGMSRLGYVIVYGQDFSRPVDNYQLALPEGLPGVWRIDTTDEGEIIVISDRSVMTFSHDRQLRWRDDLPTLTWMVVCQGDKIFVLLRDEIVVYTITISGERNIEETSRIPLAVGDVDPRNARLAVHGDTIYFIPLRQTIFVKHVPLTGAFRRFARLPLDYPDCMCVDEDGRLIVGGWSESRGAEWRGLNIFAPNGELLRELQTADSIYEVAVCPGGGIFLRTSAGLRFMENYV